MADTFASVAAELAALSKGLTDPDQVRSIAKKVGKQAQDDAVKAVRSDHSGRDYFSGWPKAKFATSVSDSGDSGVVVGPRGRGVGVWKVAEFGRHPGMSGPAAGKSGKVTKRSQRRWNGTTAPQNTWSEAEAIIEKETPKRVDREVDAVIKRTMGG